MAFENAIAAVPESAEAHNGRGWALHCLERDREAVAAFGRAIELQPNYAMAYNNRGVARRFCLAYDDAIEDFTTALDLTPSLTYAYTNRGFVHAIKGEEDAAFKDFAAALNIEPKSAVTYSDRGVVRSFLTMDTDLALADFNRAVELVPKDGDIYLNRGVFFFREGKYHAAAADFQRASRFLPRCPRTAIWLYLALAHAGTVDSAPLAQFVRDEGPEIAAWGRTLVESYLHPLTAEAFLRLAEKGENPDAPARRSEALFHLAEQALIQRQTVLAITYFERCQKEGIRDSHEHQAAQSWCRRLRQTPASLTSTP